MNDKELADWIQRRLDDEYLAAPIVVSDAKWPQIIAALRRGPEREGFYEKLWKDFVSLQRGDAQGIIAKVEAYYRERPLSGEMVMVPRKVLADIEEGYRSRCEYCRGVKAACEELDVKYGISCLAREAWCALSAAEAEGRKG